MNQENEPVTDDISFKEASQLSLNKLLDLSDLLESSLVHADTTQQKFEYLKEIINIHKFIVNIHPF